jgi:hypothetical protein
MFAIFNVLSGFRHVELNAIVWTSAGAVFVVWSRHRIAMRERRAGRLRDPSG